MLKPGYLTSELHLLLLAVGLDAGGVTPKGPAQWATALGAGLYALSRGLAKIGAGKPINLDATKLLDNLFGKEPPLPASGMSNPSVQMPSPPTQGAPTP